MKLEAEQIHQLISIVRDAQSCVEFYNGAKSFAQALEDELERELSYTLEPNRPDRRDEIPHLAPSPGRVRGQQ